MKIFLSQNGTLKAGLLLFLFSSIIPLIPLQVLAEPPRGRLADGTPFRTDAQGNQIVDYIAELEVSVEALQRRVYGLEAELEEKQKIAAMQSSGFQARSVAERDLLSGERPPSATTSARVAMPAESCPPVGITESECQERNQQGALRYQQDLQNLSEQLSETKSRYQLLQSQLQARQEELGVIRTGLSGDLQALQRELHSAHQEREELRRSHVEALQDKEKLLMVNSTLESSNERLKSDLEKSSAASDEILRLNETIRNQQGEISRLNQVVQQQNNDLRLTAANNAELDPVRSQPFTGRASLGGSVVPGTFIDRRAQTQAAPTAPSLSVRNAAVDSLRGSVRQVVDRAARLVKEREQRFKVYQAGAQNRGLVVKPHSARSSEGLSLEQIRKGIDQANSAQELAKLQRQALQIESLLKDDIALFSRIKTSL